MSVEKSISEIRGNIDQFFKTQFDELLAADSGVGRRIYILKRERGRFDKIIRKKDKSFSERYFCNQILSLRNVGYLNSQFSTVSPIARRLQLEGGDVVYAIWNGNSYITQINVSVSSEGSVRKEFAGVYRVIKEKQSWSLSKTDEGVTEQGSFQSKNLAVNGYARTIDEAAAYMPAFIKHGFGENSLKDVYSLFYNPCSGLMSSDWKSLRDIIGFDTQAAKKLADVLRLTAEKQKEVNLTVHESGHALLKAALRRVHASGQSLDKFTVFYANPIHNLHAVDKWRIKTGMKLATKAPLVNNLNARQFLLSGNFISQPAMVGRADPKNLWSARYSAVSTLGKIGGLGGISFTLFGVAGWAVGAAPFLLGQSRNLNQKVIDSPSKAVQEGMKHYGEEGKRLIWDPIHKMMVKE